MPFRFLRPKGEQRSQRRLYPVFLIPLFALILLVGFFTAQNTPIFRPLHSALADSLAPLPGTITPLLKSSKQLGPTNSQRTISLTIGLTAHNLATLSSYVQDSANPSSTNYHRHLTSSQVTSLYSPTKEEHATVLQFLQASGFTITHIYSHRLLIGFNGTVAQVEQVFHVTLYDYQAPDGTTFFANTTDPQIPISIGPLVKTLSGLNNATKFTHPRMQPKSARVSFVGQSGQAASCPQNGAQSWLAQGYNINGLYNQSIQGQGQTVALYELATFQASDIAAYGACFAPKSHIPIQTIVTGQTPVPTDAGVAEVELDAELVTSVAPQLGSLKIYEAANDAADRLAEWAQIVQDAPAVVSTSWGGCEQLSAPNEIAQENVFFTMAAAQGQTILAASGDNGSEGCMSENPNNTTLNAIDPAAQPFVTAVGGTSVIWNGSLNESTWNDQYGASGGGISQYWAAPSWQNAPGVHNSYTTGALCHTTSGFCREVPDIALNADTATGYAFYCTSSATSFCSANNPWSILGGTSAAAPIMAAVTALQNQYLLQHGSFNVGFLNPLLYQIASGANAGQSLHDVTQGPSNDYQNHNAGAYPTTTGYDMATGLGSPDAAHLAQSYLALSQQRSSPAANTWYFAEGSVGGNFQEYITLQNPSANSAAQVNITYLFESKSAVTVSHTVNASSRYTVSVNGDLNIPATGAHQSVAAIVQVANGSPGIVAERPMYFNFHGIQSGTDVVGTTTPATSYYFPIADSRNNGRSYATFITMLNPSTTQSAHVQITYYTGHCGLAGQATCPTQTLTVQPLHRGTASPTALSLYQQMSASVSSDLPIVVERPLYFSDNIPNAGGQTTGAASQIGATKPGQDWLFAEGYTGTNFQEYLVLANFGTNPTTANIQLKYENGHTQTLGVSVPALGQTYFDVNAANARPSGTCDVNPCSTTPSVSAEVTAAAPIVADRLMYFHFGGSHYSGGTDTVGEAGPASHNVYAFAEGYTGGTFSEYLTLQNPTNSDETVAITLFVDTYVMQQQVVVKAHSRRTVSINSLVNPIAQAYPNLGSNSYSVSMTVQAQGQGTTIVAERPMYFNYANADQGGTDVLGFI